jgi:hypothetical protein
MDETTTVIATAKRSVTVAAEVAPTILPVRRTTLDAETHTPETFLPADRTIETPVEDAAATVFRNARAVATVTVLADDAETVCATSRTKDTAEADTAETPNITARLVLTAVEAAADTKAVNPCAVAIDTAEADVAKIPFRACRLTKANVAEPTETSRT